MLFEPPSLPARLTQFCVAFTRFEGDLTDLEFDLLVWDSDGPDGGPGTPLGIAHNQIARDVPIFPSDPTVFFGAYDVSAADIVLTRPAYIGVRWTSRTDQPFFIEWDESETTPRQRGFIGTSSGTDPPDSERGDAFEGDDYRAMAIRALLEALPLPCGDELTLCLTGDRFEVTVDFLTPQGMSGRGRGRPVEGVDSSGFFSFFTDDNLELLVKVLDACLPILGNRYWVFFAATTNVQFTLTVTDTETGVVRSYFNPQGQSADAVTDTDAFDTCL